MRRFALALAPLVFLVVGCGASTTPHDSNTPADGDVREEDGSTRWHVDGYDDPRIQKVEIDGVTCVAIVGYKAVGIDCLDEPVPTTIP